jgi:glycerophosphoryl diester phosphodiesterase
MVEPGGRAADNVWLQRPRFSWAHQGGAREAPSNTLYAMHQGVGAGADGIEVDVHLTSDGVLVCSHDASLVRMSGRPGEIRALTHDELARYDVAARWVPGELAVRPEALRPGQTYELAGRAAADAALRVPTLAAVFDAFPGVPLTIELKGRGCEAALADFLAERRDEARDVIVVSFGWRRMRRFRKLSPTTPTAASTGRVVLFWALSWLRIAGPTGGHVALQSRWRLGPVRLVTTRVVELAHRRGLAVHAWTVDDADEMRTVLRTGADGIMTDRPTVLRDVLTAGGG